MHFFRTLCFSVFYIAKSISTPGIYKNHLSTTFEINTNDQNAALVERLYTQTDLNPFEKAIKEKNSLINMVQSHWCEATLFSIPNILLQMNTKLHNCFSKILPHPFVTYVCTESSFIYWDKDKKGTMGFVNFYPNYLIEGSDDDMRYKEYTILTSTDKILLNAEKIVHEKQAEFPKSFQLKFAKSISFLSVNKVMRSIKIYEEPCLVLLDQNIELISVENYVDGSVGFYKSYMFDLIVTKELIEGKYNIPKNLAESSISLGQFKHFCGPYQSVIYDGYKLYKYYNILKSNHNYISCIPVMLWILESNNLRIYNLSDDTKNEIASISKQITMVYTCNFVASSDENPILQSNLKLFTSILESFCTDLQDNQESMKGRFDVEEIATLRKICDHILKDLHNFVENDKKSNINEYLHFHNFLRKTIKNNSNNQKITDYLINFLAIKVAESYKNYQHFSDEHKTQLIKEINCARFPTLKCHKNGNLVKKMLPESYAAKNGMDVDGFTVETSEVRNNPEPLRFPVMSLNKSFDILDDLLLKCLVVSAAVKSKEKNEKLLIDCFNKFLEILRKLCRHEPDPNDKEPCIYKEFFLLFLSKMSILHSIIDFGKYRSEVEKCYKCGVAKFARSYGLNEQKGFFDDDLSKNMSNDERLAQYQDLEAFLEKRFGIYKAKHLMLYYDFRVEWRRPHFSAENSHIMGNIRSIVLR